MSKSKEENYYYYTNHDNAISNIKNKRIKISTYNSINDIHELLQVNCSNNELLYTKIIEAKNYMNIKRGFISFSNNWNSSIMRGHYSDNYKGICLGYTLNTDAQKNIKGIEYIHKKVNFPYNLESSNNKTINKYYESILHKKQAKWTYENEYRLNLPLIDKDPETGLYFLYLDTKIKLTEIYLGTKSDFTPYDIGGFLIRINYPNNILIYKTTPSMNTFDMEIKYSTKHPLLEYIPNEGCFDFTL